MPRTSIDIRNFHTGLVSNPDAQDIPLDACTDMDAVALDGQGKLIGLPTAGTDVGYGDGLQFPYAWLKKLDGTYTIIYSDGSNIDAVSDFYGATPTASTPISSAVAYSMVSRGLGVHVGRGTSSSPRWIGYIDYGQFSGSAPSGLQSGGASWTAECKNYQGTSAGEFNITVGLDAGSSGNFLEGYAYKWGYSLVYDNIQESPLYEQGTYYDVAQNKHKPITITAYGVASTNPRITGVNIYRAEAIDGTDATLGFYKLVTSIDINDGSWTGTTDKTYTYNDEGDATGASYEDNSGIPETATTTIVNYTFSTEVNDYLFVSKCGVTDLPDASHMIFRSKEFRYDTFDWANEYIKLPRVPTAMRGYNGQLIVWDNSTMFVINPDRFYVMNTLEGVGCSSHKSAKVTPYGLFFANSQGAYRYDGSRVERLSDPIKNLWQAETSTPEVNYDEKENLVLFHFGAECYYYHVSYGNWGYITTLLTGFTGGFQGKDGESYSVSSTVVSENFGGASTRAWDWTSKELDFGDWQDKKFYYILKDSSGTVSTLWGVNGDAADNSMTSDTEIRSDWETTATTWQQGKSIKVKFTGNAGSSVDRVEIIARTLRPITETR